MATGKITKRLVDALIADAKREGRTLITWDADLIRFGVLATRTGAAAYVIQYRLGGRGTASKRVTIGKHGAITPDEARKLASTKLGEVDRGRDVAQEKKDARRKLAAGTFKDALVRYLRMNGKDNRSWPETQRLLEFDAVPSFGNKPMTTISRADVAALLDDTAGRSHSVARALFAALRPMFRWCRDRGIIDTNPIADLKGPAPLAKRKRVLTAEEIGVFWTATGGLDWPFGPLYRLLLLTGQRREEVAGMRWEEISLSARMWRLPPAEEFLPQRTKNGEEHFVPLSPQAIAILEALPGERRGLVFTTTGKTPVSGFSKVKERLDGVMSNELGERLKPWRNHDLRRTMSTLMNERIRIAPHVVEACLNHLTGAAKVGVAGVYNHAMYLDERKAALLAWGNWIERLVSVESEPVNVVQLAEHR